MNKDEIESIEIDLLLKSIKAIYGFSFENYRYAYLERRIKRRKELGNFETITLLTNEVIKKSEVGNQLLRDLTINVTEMYRCTDFFRGLIENIFPLLQTYPSINIWHAGCSTGEEVLSLAILLKEHNLYDKCNIIATDINEESLLKAENHVYEIEKIKGWTDNYYKSGGKTSFSDYYNVMYNYAKFDSSLYKNIIFRKHDLVNDEYPTNIHLILCRNVFIYFDEDLQKKCTIGFYKSLINGGFLGIGIRESIRKIPDISFTPVIPNINIFQKER